MNKNHKLLMGTDGWEDFYMSLQKEEGSKEKHRLLANKFRGKKIQLVIEGKELWIEELIMPKVRKAYVEDIIETALVERFHFLENLAFDYKVISKNRKEIRVLVYCINLSNHILMKQESFNEVQIESIKVLQQVYGKAFMKIIKRNEFYGIAIAKKYFYFFHVKNKMLVQNKVEEFEHISELSSFLEGLCTMKNYPKVIYLHEENPCEEVKHILENFYKAYIFNISKEEFQWNNLG